MKKKHFRSSSVKQLFLAVPASALMLGAAQAGTTVGLNFQSWYYDSGTNPQTVGYGSGYQTTGFLVTARAFGVDPANWFSTDPLSAQEAIVPTSTLFGSPADLSGGSNTFAGSLALTVNAPNTWQSGIGELTAGFNVTPAIPEAVAPGNDEVTWGYLDDGNSTGNSPSASITGLAAKFPNGYVIETIAAEAGATTFDGVDFTDGITTNSVTYSTYHLANDPTANPDVAGGTVGLSAPSGKFTSDSISINSEPKTASSRSTLAAFIITDQPVVTENPANTSLNLGATLTLTASTIGLPDGLYYQWQQDGADIPGANSAIYTKAVVASTDSGDYDLVVTNLYGSATSGTAAVTVITVPSITKDLTGVTGTVYSGANFSAWSVVAAGGLPLYYEWLKDGTTAVGTDSPTLVLNNVSTADGGGYSVTVTNSLGSAQSSTNHLVVVASPDIYTTDVAKDSPSAYWTLNETSGTVAKDYSGLANDATNTGGLTLGVPGPRPPSFQGFESSKTAYQFDGASSYIDCGTASSLSGTTDFTLEAWINTTATANGMILQQRYSGGFNGEYQFNVTASGNLSFTVYGGGYQFNFGTARAVNDGLWHHVAAVRSGLNGTLYIDGTPAATAAGTTIAPLDATFTTYIGSDQRDATSYFNGLISDVAIYSYALSAHEITLHAYNGRLGNAPFSVSVVPGGFVTDSKPAGIQHPGVNNGASWTNSVTDAAAVTRTGVEVFTGNSQIAIPPNSDFDSPNGTIMFWLQANAPISGPGSEGAMLFDRRTTNGVVILLYDDGTIFWQGQAGSQNTFSTGYVPDNNWHHIALTYGQTTSDTLSIYIDGLLSASVPVTNTWSWPVTQELEIGESHDSYWQRLNGQMDDFRIYNRVLTPTEIASVQSSDALVDTSALMVRYNFDTAAVGESLSWPVGSLYSSPTLGPGAIWTPVQNATPPYPFLPPAPENPVGTALFYRAGF